MVTAVRVLENILRNPAVSLSQKTKPRAGQGVHCTPQALLGSPQAIMTAGTSGSYAPVDPQQQSRKLMCARVIGWLCGLNLLLLTLDTASQFLYAAAALENQPPVHLAHTHCASCRRSYNEANPMGALDVVADHADMAMDEGEANATSWRTVVPQLKAQVAVNTQAIEVRVCLNASISALRLSDADPRACVCVAAGAESTAGGARGVDDGRRAPQSRTR